jgi:RNA polymerase sigma-70 factor (ECF subfamily)
MRCRSCSTLEAAVKERSNEDWLRTLRATGEEQAAAVSELRVYLLRATRYALHRRATGLPHRAPTDLDQLAEDCAQEALLALLARLDSFRGDSRFTTWRNAFAVHSALVAARCEAWRTVPLDTLLNGAGELSRLGEPAAGDADPDRMARRAEAWAAIREVLDHELTDRQRRALSALIVEEVPLDELARHWGSNRNAIFKLVHDARQRLKARLASRGFPPGEILQLFAGPG